MIDRRLRRFYERVKKLENSPQKAKKSQPSFVQIARARFASALRTGFRHISCFGSPKKNAERLATRLPLRRYPKVVENERIHIGCLFELLCRAARPVAGVCVDADQDGIIAGLCCLQRRSVLERMCGD